MRKHFNKFAFLFLIGIISLTGEMYAVVPNCPPTIPGCNGWQPWQTREWEMVKPDCILSIEYRMRICQPEGTTGMEDEIENIEYRNVAVSGNCTDMLNLDVFQYHVNSLYELVDILLTADLNNSPQYSHAIDFEHDQEDLAACPNKKMFRTFYSASCGIWVKCTYEITVDNPLCETGFDLPLPDYDNHGTRKVDVYKWQPCGETCCERVYEICTVPYFNDKGEDIRKVIMELKKAKSIGSLHTGSKWNFPKI